MVEFECEYRNQHIGDGRECGGGGRRENPGASGERRGKAEDCLSWVEEAGQEDARTVYSAYSFVTLSFRSSYFRCCVNHTLQLALTRVS